MSMTCNWVINPNCKRLMVLTGKTKGMTFLKKLSSHGFMQRKKKKHN